MTVTVPRSESARVWRRIGRNFGVSMTAGCSHVWNLCRVGSYEKGCLIVLKLDAIVQKFITIRFLCRKRIQYPHSAEIPCARIEHLLVPKLATHKLGMQDATRWDYERAKHRWWFRSGICLKVSTSKYQCDQTQRGNFLKVESTGQTATYPNLIAKMGRRRVRCLGV